MSTEISQVIATEIQAVASDFLELASNVRTAISRVIREQPYAANHAVIQAEFLLEDRMDDGFKAYVKRCVDKKRLTTVGNPSFDEVLSVVCQAAAKGISFGDDEFQVWKGGKLYLTKNGYKALFALRGNCSVPKVDPGVPEWKVLKERNMWVCDGRGSVMCDGEPVYVERNGDYKLGINGNATDAIANIQGKAARALYKQLWEMISPFKADDISDEADTDYVRPQTAPKIESKPAADPWAVEYERLKSPRAKDAWQFVLNATELAAIDLAENSFGKIDATGPEKQSLKRFAEHRRDVLKGVA